MNSRLIRRDLEIWKLPFQRSSLISKRNHRSTYAPVISKSRHTVNMNEPKKTLVRTPSQVKRGFNFKDLTGQRFERLVVIGYAGPNKSSKSTWLCLCDCGNEKVIAASNLRNGSVKSCSCLNTESRGIIHGDCAMATGGDTREYRIWRGMKRRCLELANKDYQNYGGRGIKVCDRWMVFQNFLDDMGRCPDGMCIERKNTNGNYEPSNCEWSTMVAQANNRRTNHLLEFNGQIKTVADWGREVKIHPDTLFNRLGRGWSVEKVLTTPLGKSNRGIRASLEY